MITTKNCQSSFMCTTVIKKFSTILYYRQIRDTHTDKCSITLLSGDFGKTNHVSGAARTDEDGGLPHAAYYHNRIQPKKTVKGNSTLGCHVHEGNQERNTSLNHYNYLFHLIMRNTHLRTSETTDN